MFEVTLEVEDKMQKEIIRHWAERKTDELADLLGPTYRRDLLCAMPEEEIREWVKHRDWERQQQAKDFPSVKAWVFAGK